MVLFANAPRLHRDAMAAAFSARGRHAGVAIPEGWSLAEALRQLDPAVVVVSGSPEEARRLSHDVNVAHLDGEDGSMLTTYRSGSAGTRMTVGSFEAIAQELETLAGADGRRDRPSVIRL